MVTKNLCVLLTTTATTVGLTDTVKAPGAVPPGLDPPVLGAGPILKPPFPAVGAQFWKIKIDPKLKTPRKIATL
jgi:hypothetical protein